MQTLDNPFVGPVDDDPSSHDPLCLVDDEEKARIEQYIQDGLITPEEATDFVGGKHL